MSKKSTFCPQRFSERIVSKAQQIILLHLLHKIRTIIIIGFLIIDFGTQSFKTTNLEGDFFKFWKIKNLWEVSFSFYPTEINGTSWDFAIIWWDISILFSFIPGLDKMAPHKCFTATFSRLTAVSAAKGCWESNDIWKRCGHMATRMAPC